jgi:L-glyceraldehyde 3-phosphate reductase
VAQLEDNLDARLKNLDFAEDELVKIDKHAVEAGINLWKTSSEK